MKGFRLRNVVAIFLLVLMGASVLMAHVWKQNAYVRLSKESVKLAREGKVLRDGIALLEMEAGDLKKPGRIEGLARERFGLVYGNNPVLVYPDGDGGAEGTLARKGSGASPAETGKAAWPTSGL